MQKIFLLAQDTGEPIDDRIHGVKDMPWSWVRLAFYIKRVKSVLERAAITNPDRPDLATPLRWVFFDDEKLDEWFKAQKGAL